MNIKTLLIVIAIGAAGVSGYQKMQQVVATTHSEASGNTADSVLANAFNNQQSNLQVTVSARVVKVLPDDNKGSRHQRFLIELGNGQTILVAHNIDLAGYVDGLTEGSQVTVSGEYEWNDKGGVIHWTHHDPNGSHQGGWITFNGNTYQ